MVETTSARAAQKQLVDKSFDLLVVDNLMPGMTGLELIRELSQTMPPSSGRRVLMMTAHATVESAIEAMKLGALDYLQKPFEVEELLALVSHALEHQRLRSQRQYSDQRAQRRVQPLRHRRTEPRDAGGDPARRARGADQEHGPHHRRDRHRQGDGRARDPPPQRAADMPLIKVNCAAIPETLLESELFGHVRGAFTGATMTKRGKFALAGWRIDLPRRDRHADHVDPGEAAARPPGARIRAARRGTDPAGRGARHRRHQPRSQADGGDGKFLEDLYYRLNVIPIEIPPLRDRREDIAVLDRSLRGQAHGSATGKRIERLEDDVVQALTQLRLARQRARAREHDRARGGRWRPAR